MSSRLVSSRASDKREISPQRAPTHAVHRRGPSWITGDMRPILLLCLTVATAAADPRPAVVSETRPVAAFHGLAVETVVDVELAIGPTTRVEVTAPKDFLPKLETKVTGGSLHIATPNVKGKLPDIKVTITTPSLDAIAIEGVAKIHAVKLAASSLAIAVDGAGNLDLSGKANELQIAVSGALQLQARDLVVQTGAVQVSGTCSGTLDVRKSLAAAISGVGNLVVYGKPSITRSISGIGTIEER
jgi:hypothetical protein